ncbi:aquaporin [Streptomyces sp. NPDC058394]|uniref:aquaporin n=1 Tax=Streptomyces sp. NPDC058394 TaxID=3346477 RepID=UPI003649593C
MTRTSLDTGPRTEGPPVRARRRMPRLLEVALYEFALSTAMLFTVVTAVRWMAGPGTPFAALFPTPTTQLVAMGLLVGVIVALVLGPSMRRETAGHLNPAVSIGLWLLRVLPARVVAPFVVAQLAGSVAGVALARLVWGEAAARVGDAALRPAADWSIGAVFAAEAAAMAVIMLITAFAGTRPHLLKYLPAVVGASVAAVIVFLGPLSGGGANPARQFGPALVSGTTGLLWVYVRAPVAGSSFAALVAVLLKWRAPAR